MLVVKTYLLGYIQVWKMRPNMICLGQEGSTLKA